MPRRRQHTFHCACFGCVRAYTAVVGYKRRGVSFIEEVNVSSITPIYFLDFAFKLQEYTGDFRIKMVSSALSDYIDAVFM